MAKPRTIAQIQRDQIRKTTELLKGTFRLMARVGPPRSLTRILDQPRQSGDPRILPHRD